MHFERVGGGAVAIETTRPELLPACVALVAHPNDARYQPLFGHDVLTPLFRAPVPVLAHPLADPEKGTGIAMICTFGDLTDVTWWRELGLPVRAVIQPNGTLKKVIWGAPGWPSDDPVRSQSRYDELAGLSIGKARARIVEQLRESGELVGEPRPVTHNVKFYEKGDRPLEIITSRQWFIKTVEYREALLQRGLQLRWHPDYMRVRFENWVNGLAGDWCISRQRFFGVPFPVWYAMGPDGTADHRRPIVPDESRLPIDPSTDVPDGYRADQRGQPGGFAADPDVMDTWATSSLTPQVVGRWQTDDDFFQRVFPMDLRPQGHDIIRTWLFPRAARISNTTVSLDRRLPVGVHRRRTQEDVEVRERHPPIGLLEEHGSDGVSNGASGRPAPTVFDASRCGSGAGWLSSSMRRVHLRRPIRRRHFESRRRGMLTRLSASSMRPRGARNGDYTPALERSELLLVFATTISSLSGAALATTAPRRRLGECRDAAGLSSVLRLFAPFLPFVTEEVWSWWQPGSIHRAEWPTPGALLTPIGGEDRHAEEALAEGCRVLGDVRKRKSEEHKPLRTPVIRATIKAPRHNLDLLEAVWSDVSASGVFRTAPITQASESFEAVYELGEPEARKESMA